MGKNINYNFEKKRIIEQWETFFDDIVEKQKAHDLFMSDGILPDERVIAPAIVESWKRSLSYGLNPKEIEPKYVPFEEFQKKLIENENLIKAAAPILEEFAEQFSANFFTVDLYDKDLCLLQMYGKQSELKNRPAYVKPGILRDEEACGTTSMSYAKERMQISQLIGGEHFSDSMLDNVCTAAVIKFEGECIGLINVVEHQWKKDSRTMGTLVGLAKLVEYNLEQQKLRNDLISEVSLNEVVIESISDGVFLLSSQGMILKTNDAACRLLGYSREEIEGSNANEIFKDNNSLISAIKLGIPIIDQEMLFNIHGETKRFIGTARPIKVNHKINQVLVSLKDMKSMRKIIKSVGGWKATYTFDSIIGESPIFKQAVAFAEQTAMMDSNTLIEGASGTGKELFAHSIHNAGPLSSGPFVSVNCASIPMSLLESELFGYESGAFTGAKKTGQPGKFELAEGGTIFLDEINSIPLDVQVKLLRVLQDKKITRIGGNSNVSLHLKIIAASNEKLWDLVQQGRFREDLFYRLNVITIHIPPLSEHSEDIPLIAENILSRLSQSYNENISISEEGQRLLMAYNWPGNVRELENIIERSFVSARLRKSKKIDVVDIQGLFNYGSKNGKAEINRAAYQGNLQTPTRQYYKANEERFSTNYTDLDNLEDAERILIEKCLIKHGRNISAVARELGMARNTLYQRIKKYKL